MTRISRRRLIKMAGIGGMAAVASAGGSATATNGQLDGAEAFLAWAYQQRAHAVTTGNPAVLNQIYDTANGVLLASERERPRLIRSSKIIWPGEVLWNASTIEIVALEVSGSSAHARLIERFETRWRPEPPAPHPRGALRMAAPLGIDRATSSIAHIKHEVDLVRSGSGWRIGQDQHDEFYLHGKSPDLRRGSWAAERYGLTAFASSVDGTIASGKGPGLASPTPLHLTYNQSNAYVYGQAWAEWPGNSSYCNFGQNDQFGNSCGGDCTNFVSQCFRAGGHPDIGAWRTFNGGCLGCSGFSSTMSGDTSWIRVVEVWSILMNNGRAFAEDNVNDLATSHLIEYDWTKNGTWDHATMTSFWSGGAARVVSHSPFLKNYHWQLDDSDALWRYAYINNAFHT